MNIKPWGKMTGILCTVVLLNLFSIFPSLPQASRISCGPLKSNVVLAFRIITRTWPICRPIADWDCWGWAGPSPAFDVSFNLFYNISKRVKILRHEWSHSDSCDIILEVKFAKTSPAGCVINVRVCGFISTYNMCACVCASVPRLLSDKSNSSPMCWESASRICGRTYG